MTYTYDIENKNNTYVAQIAYTNKGRKDIHAKNFNTEAEAETWATTSIQSMKDNNNVFVNENTLRGQ
jgi:hypothetical protein